MPPTETKMPKMEVPFDEWVMKLIKTTVREHASSCPMQARVAKLELRFAALVGFMLGSGFLGGVVGSVMAKALL